MSLYNEYRPRDWDSVIGQYSISSILRTSLIQGHIGHAYILTGSRGTGKTTTARILAKWVNCLDLQNGNPCHKCTHCVAFDAGNMLDCIEIDGASNNGVENVRDLIEKAKFEPNQWKFKIYIIDEVHMLSTGAFNALLKTLEEPPDHVKFILATTEIDKVPETIRSRSLRFDFKKISESDIVKRLEFVCGEESIKAEKEWLEIIARAARGALRDALTLTEQNTVNGEIKTEYVRSTLSLIEDSLIEEIIRIISHSDKDAMIQMLDTLRTRHAEVRWLFDQILYGLRDLMLESFGWKTKNPFNFAEYSEIFAIFESAYSKIKIIPDGWLLIEITMLRAVARRETKKNIWIVPISEEKWWIEWTQRGLGRGTVWIRWEQESGWAELPSFSLPNSFGTFSTKSTPEIVSEEKIKLEKIIPEWQKKKETEEKTKKEDSELNSEWQKTVEWKDKKEKTASSSFSYIRLLEEIKKNKATLVLDLKTARFEHSGNILTLIFSKEWHYNRANTPSMRGIICENLEIIYGGNWKVECRLDWNTIGANIVDEVF